MLVEHERAGAAQMLSDGHPELVHPYPQHIATLADVKRIRHHNAH